MANGIKDIREFGRFRLDAQKCVLWHDSEPVKLPLKEIEVLCALTENVGEVLTKDELLQKVWADSFVEESNLSRHVYRLRKMFKGFGEKDLIQTVPRRGYRFTGSVCSSSTDELIIERHSLTRTVAQEISDVGERYRVPSPKLWSLAGGGFVLFLIVVAGLFLDSKSVSTAEVNRSSAGSNSGFADNDAVTTDLGYPHQKAQAIALQPDGYMVVGGWVGEHLTTSEFAMARYGPDGVLDPNFGSDGKVVTPMGPNTDIINAVAVQHDGKIIAAGVNFTGVNTRQYCVLRYKPDGALDASFDGDGIVMLNIGTRSMDTAYAVAVQPDGKVVVAGSAFMRIETAGSFPSQNDFGMARLNADGSLDTGFGDQGKVITDFGFGSDVAYSMAVQPDGKVVLAGVATNGTDQDFALARYLPDGTLDAAFGKDGKVRTDFAGGDDLVSAIAIQPDGNIVCTGYTGRGDLFDVAVTRYTADGSLDNTFGDNGKATMDVSNHDIGRAVAIQPDNRIVMGIYADYGAASKFAFIRLLPNGLPDQDFGVAGTIRVPTRSNGEAYGMVLTSDRKAILAGSIGDKISSNFALVRANM